MKIKRKRFLLITIFLLPVIIFLIYLINRYLIPKVDIEISNIHSAKSIEQYEVTENTYKSQELEITIDKKEIGEGNNKITYFIADIKLTNPSRLKKAFAKNQIGTNITEEMNKIVSNNNAILAINGDYYSFRNNGVIIADSVIYRNVPAREALAIYTNGEMKIYDETKISAEELIKNGVKDTLSFGPVLVRDGKADANFTEYAVDGDNIIRSNIASENPRTGIGYYEIGHYCFVVADGRKEGYSKGMTLQEFAQLFEDLGCSLAYNLDGGNSSNMYFMGNKINISSQPGNGERDISDIYYIY